ETAAIQASAAQNNAMPPPTISLLPTRTASLVPATDATPTETATGSSRTPVDSGLEPRTTWKYWVIRKMNPSSAKNASATETLAAVNRGLRNSRTSIIGAAVARSAATSAASRTTPAASEPRVAAEVQPQPGAWMIP